MDKQKAKPDDPKQSERFVEDAEKLEVDESGKSFERVLHKVMPEQVKPRRPPRQQEARDKECPSASRSSHSRKSR
jgi:hypothetical protein